MASDVDLSAGTHGYMCQAAFNAVIGSSNLSMSCGFYYCIALIHRPEAGLKRTPSQEPQVPMNALAVMNADEHEPLTTEEAFLGLQQFVEQLGWHGLRIQESVSPPAHSIPDGLSRYFYTIGEMDDGLYVQINPKPEFHPRLFAMSVYAMRYRICSGWHAFLLPPTSSVQNEELAKIEPWTGHARFDSQSARRDYRQRHPECAGYSWRRIRSEGPPYTHLTCYERWRK